jgi:hypothetical protein
VTGTRSVMPYRTRQRVDAASGLWRAARVAVALLAAVAGGGCSHGAASRQATAGTPRAERPSASRGAAHVARATWTVAGVVFVPAAPKLHRDCAATADAVGYAVPCPTRLPIGLAGTPPVGGCPRWEIVGWARPSRTCTGAVSWRGWIVGSSETSRQHLVVQGAPRVVRDPARAINGPGWYRGNRVQARGGVRVAGQTMRWYYVPPSANEGSAFAHHLVLVWNESGHTYAYGFHVVKTLADTRPLDLELVRHLSLVGPRRTH